MTTDNMTTTSTNSNKASDIAKFLKLPLTIAISSCLLVACQNTPKATKTINEAPANVQAQQAGYDPTITQKDNQITEIVEPPTTPSTIPQPVNATPSTSNVKLPNLGVQQRAPQTFNNGDNLNILLNARSMIPVNNDLETLNKYGSVWERLIHAFRIPQPNNNNRIDAERQWFLNNAYYLNDMSARASRYIYHTASEAARRGLPSELALVPILESSYDPSATSNADGVGLWQFIPSTGRIYGLNQSRGYDARRDVVESTRAAYDFLTSLYNQFGSWELALAAYNAGPGRVQSAIDYNKSKGLPTDYWSLNLPPSAMTYVPRLMALSQIIGNPPKYNVSFGNIANKRYFRTVPVNVNVSLSDVSNVTGVHISELQLLNPALTELRIDAIAPKRVVIPDSLDTSVDAKIRALQAGGKTGTPATAETQNSNYIVAIRNFTPSQYSQDELSDTRTLPISATTLTNNHTIIPTPNLTNEEKTLLVRQLQNANPIVPVISQVDGNIQLLAVTTGQGVLDNSNQQRYLKYSATFPSYTPIANTPSKDPAPAAVETAQKPVSTPVATTDKTVKPTDKTTKTEKPVTKTEKTEQPKTAQTKAPAKKGTYVVKSGDTLSGLASRYNTTQADIAALNNFAVGAKLSIGQTLNMPVAINEKTSDKANENKADSKKADNKPTTKTETKAEPKKTVATTKYTVKKGDSLIKLAKQNNISVSELMALNGLKEGDQLKIGNSIVLPKGTADTKTEKTESKPEPKTVAKTEKTEPKSEPKSEPKPEPKAQTTGKAIKNTENYTVQKGDSLIKLAKQYGVSSEDLAKTNNIANDASLKSGQTIKVPKLHSTYTVKKGDSLIKIAKHYGISAEELAKLNGLKSGDAVKAGQNLTVPNR